MTTTSCLVMMSPEPRMTWRSAPEDEPPPREPLKAPPDSVLFRGAAARYGFGMRMKIGFLGLGTMGAPLANNLRKAGYVVTAWNRTAARAEYLVKKGATLASTPRECATGQDLVFTCLSDEKALEAVLEGEDGVLAALKAGD